MLVKDVVLEHGNSVQTPATHDATEEEDPSQVQYSKYRSQVARCLFLSEDRADTTLVVNELCQRMSSPKQQSLAKLKRLAKYLKRERQWGQIFGCGRLVEEMTTFTDSDWAGCKETRKLSSAGVIMLGDHASKAHTRQQKIIARSSTEAELYAAAMAASESKEIVLLSRDPGYEMKPFWPLMRCPLHTDFLIHSKITQTPRLEFTSLAHCVPLQFLAGDAIKEYDVLFFFFHICQHPMFSTIASREAFYD